MEIRSATKTVLFKDPLVLIIIGIFPGRKNAICTYKPKTAPH